MIGFTGTQDGMTEAQKTMLKKILEAVRPKSVVHGDCIGSDATFHEIVCGLTPRIYIITYPADIKEKRANCQADEVMPEQPPLKRNKNIVNSSDRLIATPKEDHEVLRSGTWSTIRFARRMRKPLLIINPNGSARRDRARGAS